MNIYWLQVIRSQALIFLRFYQGKDSFKPWFQVPILFLIFVSLLVHLPVSLASHLAESHCLNLCVSLECFSLFLTLQSSHFPSFPSTAAGRAHLCCHLRASQVWPYRTGMQPHGAHHANLFSGWLWDTLGATPVLPTEVVFSFQKDFNISNLSFAEVPMWWSTDARLSTIPSSRSHMAPLTLSDSL